MTLLFAGMILCVRVFHVGCVYHSYAEAGCVLTIIVPLDARFGVNKKHPLSKKYLRRGRV